MEHLAIVMDGNRRWAQKKGLAKWLGHKEGAKAIDNAVDFCLGKEIKYLSLYTFSLENLEKRPKIERDYIFSLFLDEYKNIIPKSLDKGVKIKFVGDRSRYPEDIMQAVNEMESQTAKCSNLQLNFLFFYGGTQEIFWGIKELIKKIKNEDLDPDSITEDMYESCLWSYGIPEPELIVRTGGRRRISNFLLYKAAYSEIEFLDCLWPDITQNDLQTCFERFEHAQRNFGV